jgi:hypothetical protein
LFSCFVISLNGVHLIDAVAEFPAALLHTVRNIVASGHGSNQIPSFLMTHPAPPSTPIIIGEFGFFILLIDHGAFEHEQKEFFFYFWDQQKRPLMKAS